MFVKLSIGVSHAVRYLETIFLKSSSQQRKIEMLSGYKNVQRQRASDLWRPLQTLLPLPLHCRLLSDQKDICIPGGRRTYKDDREGITIFVYSFISPLIGHNMWWAICQNGTFGPNNGSKLHN